MGKEAQCRRLPQGKGLGSPVVKLVAEGGAYRRAYRIVFGPYPACSNTQRATNGHVLPTPAPHTLNRTCPFCAGVSRTLPVLPPNLCSLTLLPCPLPGAPSPSLRYITSLYFVVITFTTVGYGDIVPVTAAERFLWVQCLVPDGVPGAQALRWADHIPTAADAQQYPSIT